MYDVCFCYMFRAFFYKSIDTLYYAKIFFFILCVINVPVKEGKGPVGTRGARVVWALEGRYLVVMGFDKYAHMFCCHIKKTYRENNY